MNRSKLKVDVVAESIDNHLHVARQDEATQGNTTQRNEALVRAGLCMPSQAITCGQAWLWGEDSGWPGLLGTKRLMIREMVGTHVCGLLVCLLLKEKLPFTPSRSCK